MIINPMYRFLLQQKIATVFIVGFFLFACNQAPVSTNSDTYKNLDIKTAYVIRGDITDTITIYGELALRQEAWLSSQFEGRLTSFSLLKGDRVKKGELVGIIIPAGREALLQASDSIRDELKPLLEQQVKSIQLFSPISGTVLDVMLHTGDVVSKGEHIAHIGDLQILDVQGELPIQYLEDAKKAKTLKVRFTNFSHPVLDLPVEKFTGGVTQNQSLIVRMKLNNPSLKFHPGMRVKISFTSPLHKQSLLIPRSALVEEEGQYFVFVIEEGRAMKHRVRTGIMHADYIEILSGLEENQLVAVEKAYSLKDNMEVTAR